MGISRREDGTLLICDVCKHFEIVPHGTAWDETRAAAARAGWRLGKGATQQAQAFCSRCNAESGYSIDDVLGSN